MELRDITLGHCFPHNNVSCLKRIFKQELYLFFYIFAGVVTAVTICGNLFVIISVSHFKQLHTPSNLLVLSLAVVDFLIGLLVMPFQLFTVVEYCWYYNSFCSTYLTYCYMLNSISVVNMINISIDRYFAVCEPLIYSSKVTNYRMGLWISFSWACSILYTLTFLYFSGGEISTSLCLGSCRLLHYYEWWITNCFVIFILPFSLMIWFYARVFQMARKHAQAIAARMQQAKSTDRKKSNISSESKAARTLGIVVIVFIICWSPMNIMSACMLFVSFSGAFLKDMQDGFSWLTCINSGMNPIIYALFYPWFRKTLKSIATFQIFSPDSSVVNLYVN